MNLTAADIVAITQAGNSVTIAADGSISIAPASGKKAAGNAERCRRYRMSKHVETMSEHVKPCRNMSNDMPPPPSPLSPKPPIPTPTPAHTHTRERKMPNDLDFAKASEQKLNSAMNPPPDLLTAWDEWQAYRQRRHLAKGQERLPWTAQAARLSAGRFVVANAKHGTRIVCDRIASAICGNWQGDNLDKLNENDYGNTRPTNQKNIGSMAEKPRPGQVAPGGLNSTAANFTGGLFDARGRHSGADEG